MPEDFVLTNKIVSVIVDCYLLNSSIEQTPLPLHFKKDLVFQAFTDNLYYISTAMGISITQVQAKRFARGRNIPNTSIKDKKIVNTRNALEFIRSSASGKQMNLQVALHVNKLLTDGLVEIWDVGRFKNPGEKSHTEQIFSDGFSSEENVYELVNKEMMVLNSPEYEEINLLLKIPLVLKKLLKEKPFISYNDQTLILLLHFLLTKNKFSPYVSSGKLILRRREEFVEIFEKTREGNNDSVWVEFFLEQLRNDLKNIYDLVKPRSLLKEGNVKSKILELNRRQMKLIHYVADHGEVTREVGAKLNHTSISTTFRDLTFLCNKSFLKRQGQGKNTKYIANDEEKKELTVE